MKTLRFASVAIAGLFLLLLTTVLAVANQGTLEHFAGDGLMVFFNDPAPVADHHNRTARLKFRDTRQKVLDHRPPGNRVEHLVQVAFHARALARGKDDNGQITHGAMQCHQMLAV